MQTENWENICVGSSWQTIIASVYEGLMQSVRNTRPCLSGRCPRHMLRQIQPVKAEPPSSSRLFVCTHSLEGLTQVHGFKYHL